MFISTFASLVGSPMEITNSAIGLKICAITSGIKNCKSIIKKNKRDEIVLLANSNFNSIDVFICKVLIDSDANHDECALINNALKEFYYMKKGAKSSNDKL